MSEYKTIPGRGLLTQTAIQMRIDYLKELGYGIDAINHYLIDPNILQKNIESFIGTVEIPIGAVGPLLYCENDAEEWVYTAIGTLEGALVSSMNRGAKAISLSGGFTAKVIHQKMVRSPLFVLSDSENAKILENWIDTNVSKIKSIAESYSNHATLIEITKYRDKNNLHLNFVYTTGDAAGQNMTTTCTWHAVLWIVKEFKKVRHQIIEDYVLEGNGSSDKKVSQFLIDHGRGVRVEAHAILKEEVIQKILRTDSETLLKFYQPSRAYANVNGMVGYSINVANAIAGIFAATGQDLASVAESSVALLDLKKHTKGLEVKLTLYSLVVGTLGGGTHLPKQQESLRLMDCVGENKIERFASLIAGFTLGLELSTYSAMVSGEFAKAHEKLGRNKPVEWLQWQEIDANFIKSILPSNLTKEINSIEIYKDGVENGIIMNLCKRVNRKLIGFIPLEIKSKGENIPILLKSKATDLETVKGIHMMAASIDPKLCDLITRYKNNLEYKGTHLKELSIPKFLHVNELHITPKYYGQYINESREIYILAQERLIESELELLDSENKPELWTEKHIKSAIKAINSAHLKYLDKKAFDSPTNLSEFKVSDAIPLYKKLIEIAEREEEAQPEKYAILHDYLKTLADKELKLNLPKTLIHNDYNPRNIAIRSNGEICVYDWELAVINYPHRDIVELLSFTLNKDFDSPDFLNYITYHYEISGKHLNIDWENWKTGYVFALKEFILTRVLFYNSAQVVMKLKFVNRIYENCIKMLAILENEGH